MSDAIIHLEQASADAVDWMRQNVAYVAEIATERDRLKAELAKLQAEREPRDNGDGTETRLLPVTYPNGLDVIEARAPKCGETFFVFGGPKIATIDGPSHRTYLILRPAPKPPEPVAWEAPLADGHWLAEPLAAYGSGDVRLPWGVVRDLVRPSRLGCYRFTNGVGTLIEAAQ